MMKPRTAVRWLTCLVVAGAVATGVEAPAQASTGTLTITHIVTPTRPHVRPSDTNWNGT
jgi:hypothetical protein